MSLDYNAILFAAIARTESVVFDDGWPANAASRLAIVLVWQHLPCCERTRIARAWLEFDNANGGHS